MSRHAAANPEQYADEGYWDDWTDAVLDAAEADGSIGSYDVPSAEPWYDTPEGPVA